MTVYNNNKNIYKFFLIKPCIFSFNNYIINNYNNYCFFFALIN